MLHKHAPINGYLYIVFWLVIFGSMAFMFYRWHDMNFGGVEKITDSDKMRTVLIRMDSNNYYRAYGTIDGIKVRFIIDTGANSVAIPEWLAKKIGIKYLHEMRVQTAGGEVRGYLARIKHLTVGSIQLYNIRAMVMQDDSKYILLGMSALRQLEFRQRDNFLVLIQHKKKRN